MAKDYNAENLRSFADIDEKEHKKISAKGGANSQKTRKRRKMLKEQLEILLSMPLNDEEIKEQIKDLGIISDDETNNQMAIVIALYEKALSGDTKAFEIIRDTVGEKPKDEVKYKDITPKWFKEWYYETQSKVFQQLDI